MKWPAIDFQVRDLGVFGRTADQPAVDQPVVVAKLAAQLANLQRPIDRLDRHQPLVIFALQPVGYRAAAVGQ